jgi:hypothetical protein
MTPINPLNLNLANVSEKRINNLATLSLSILLIRHARQLETKLITLTEFFPNSK